MLALPAATTLPLLPLLPLLLLLLSSSNGTASTDRQFQCTPTTYPPSAATSDPRWDRCLARLAAATPSLGEPARSALLAWAIDVYGAAMVESALRADPATSQALPGLPGSRLHPPAQSPKKVAIVTAGMSRTYIDGPMWSGQKALIEDTLRSFGHEVDHYLCVETGAVIPACVLEQARPARVLRLNATSQDTRLKVCYEAVVAMRPDYYEWFVRSRPDLVLVAPVPPIPDDSVRAILGAVEGGDLGWDWHHELTNFHFGVKNWVTRPTCSVCLPPSKTSDRRILSRSGSSALCSSSWSHPCISIRDAFGYAPALLAASYFAAGPVPPDHIPTRGDSVTSRHACAMWEASRIPYSQPKGREERRAPEAAAARAAAARTKDRAAKRADAAAETGNATEGLATTMAGVEAPSGLAPRTPQEERFWALHDRMKERVGRRLAEERDGRTVLGAWLGEDRGGEGVEGGEGEGGGDGLRGRRLSKNTYQNFERPFFVNSDTRKKYGPEAKFNYRIYSDPHISVRALGPVRAWVDRERKAAGPTTEEEQRARFARLDVKMREVAETPLIFTCPTHHAMVATEHAKIVSAAAKRGKEAPSTPAPAKSHDALARRTIDRSEEKRATPGRKGRKKFVTAGGGAGRRTSGASNPAAAVAMVVGKGVRSISYSGRGITLSGADSEAASDLPLVTSP